MKLHVNLDGLCAKVPVIRSVLNKKAFASVRQQRPLIKQLHIPPQVRVPCDRQPGSIFALGNIGLIACNVNQKAVGQFRFLCHSAESPEGILLGPESRFVLFFNMDASTKGIPSKLEFIPLKAGLA